MTTTWLILKLFHLLGMALMVGGAAVKVALLLQARADAGFVPVYLRVARPITRFIVLGLVLATISGVAWLVQGRPFTPALVAKIAFGVALWAVGPIIDKVVEPRFARLAAAPGTASGPAERAGRQYLALELVATGLTAAVAVLGVLA